MSQNPLSVLRRKTPRARKAFPDDSYQETVLQPLAESVEELLARPAQAVYRAHTVMLGERRIIDPPVAAAILSAIAHVEVDSSAPMRHPLAQLERSVIESSTADVLHGSAPEEIAATAIRMAMRDRTLDLVDAIVDMRSAIADLASANPLTLLLATSNGQVIQPTTLGHYLHAHIGPLSRTTTRLRECFARLNQSPMGAVSGMSTAMPISPKRVADLLGFAGVIENSFDALAGNDVSSELVSNIAISALETSRLIADLQFWARDDIGLLVPGDEFVHDAGAQPQRRDPLVLDHLRSVFGRLSVAPSEMTAVLMYRPMIPGALQQIEAFQIVDRALKQAIAAYRLLARVVRSAVVNRSLFAHRSNRGFSTSSELADLLAVDFRLPRDEAYALTERVVIEWTEQGGEATTLTPDFIDRIALSMIGRELGVDPELLAKCLSPKRFVERRDVVGGPAPAAVGSALDRESFALNRERGWTAERRDELSRAMVDLKARCDEIIGDPAAATRRSDAGTEEESY